MRYIDVTTHDDYDRAVRFLLANRIPIVTRDKVKLVISAELSLDQEDRMLQEAGFEENVLFGDRPL